MTKNGYNVQKIDQKSRKNFRNWMKIDLSCQKKSLKIIKNWAKMW